ncbi:MAG TPA: glycosyl hydrolase, partial [Puia sp.]
VSSAAHLKGKRHISCEELTNTDMVFNDTLEILKIAGDQSALSGVTHPVFHGFNYSPPDAPFPGWIRYGTYFNEKNTWWPYFRKFTDYKARMSALLQQGDMFADIAVLPPVADMWSIFGAQNEPFPSLMYPTWMTFVWEVIHQNGNACDYVSEQVIMEATVDGGWMRYGPRKYHTLFLARVERMDPAVVRKLRDFVAGGGRIFCIETMPDRSTGWQDHERRDAEVRKAVEEMKKFPDRFILLKRPEKGWLLWYKDIQQQYGITPYVGIDNPDAFVTQVRYQAGKTEVLFFINSSVEKGYRMNLTVHKDIAAGRQAWVWDAETGDRWHIGSGTERIALELGPAESRLIVFDGEKRGAAWRPTPVGTGQSLTGVTGVWNAEFRHIDGTVKSVALGTLKDLKDMPEWTAFSGVITYRIAFTVGRELPGWLNLGKVAGVSEVVLNGKVLEVKWYGRRIFPVTGVVQAGENVLEVKVATSMGNYMKTLKDNPVAQYWTNEKRKDQPIQSMGLIGPVTIYPL